MSNAQGPESQQLWVLFREAVSWIAYRCFSGGAFGPRPIRELPLDEDDDEEYNMGLGRLRLAEQILVDHAAKGKIRIHARDGQQNNLEDENEDDDQPSIEFLARAELAVINDEGYTIFTRGERGRSYRDLAINYADLVREFWGDDEAPELALPETTARPEPDVVPLRRRGRRPRYPWPNFAAELLRRSLSGPPIENQAALEKHMLEWCAVTWGAEPAASEIREWVRPTFQMLRRSPAAVAVLAPTLTVGNSSPEIAEPAGK